MLPAQSSRGRPAPGQQLPCPTLLGVRVQGFCSEEHALERAALTLVITGS